MNQTECKHCGLHATWHIDDDTVFACGTIYAGRGDYWNQSTGCVEIMQSRERIKRAVDKLKAADRYKVTPVSRIHVEYYTSDDGLVDSAEVDEAIAILEGERDET